MSVYSVYVWSHTIHTVIVSYVSFKSARSWQWSYAFNKAQQSFCNNFNDSSKHYLLYFVRHIFRGIPLMWHPFSFPGPLWETRERCLKRPPEGASENGTVQEEAYVCNSPRTIRGTFSLVLCLDKHVFDQLNLLSRLNWSLNYMYNDQCEEIKKYINCYVYDISIIFSALAHNNLAYYIFYSKNLSNVMCYFCIDAHTYKTSCVLVLFNLLLAELSDTARA